MMETEKLLKDYSTFAGQRARKMEDAIMDMLHAAVGISGEAGELLDAIKKVWIYKKPVDVDNIKEELGDLLFYIQMMCNVHGWKLDEVIKANISKLTIRYPEGYSHEAAQARADKQEKA